ncbi:MAG: nucleoside permease [Bacteroidetes bacterium GWF2_42_66]|nr:MAG: nucleoside permease [Bacteroidetes bacterium GWA2_42_15]OFY01760.1 MAG: nucleoside permease [Bacteroidetes bacterium GWE2_42_39]OFY44948.1 MAG: nucleoside permease [Bacteroidetes bacterium GWF2_42_66]HBL76081.1 MFS transporter [Prolixibacteraceae bacterium]HCR90202.1 MFS transporter [Prolixibacteraceae bacterium]
MGIKYRLITMNFLQFFIWGAWLISIGGYLGGTLHFSGVEIGAVFSTLGIASMFMPAVMGIIADKWINAERLLGICHLLGAVMLLWASTVKDANTFFYVMLLNSMFYMPTIALNSTVSYIVLEQKGYNVVKDFPPIRVWGTIGFILAMWIVDLCGWKSSSMQLVFSSVSSVALGIYAFTMPPCKPENSNKNRGLLSTLGLDALVLFKQSKMAVFFLFAMFLGAALQITNAFGGSFLESFNLTHPDTFGVKHPIVLLSISQMSETLFILTIPFFLNKFGIKKVMIIAIFAWVLRFGLFSFGDPGSGLPLLILSMIIYGMAFDFFNISGSLFVEKEVPSNFRASAQGLFMLVTNGFGATLGGYCSGLVVDYFTAANGLRDWPTIWLCFAAYALVLGLTFPFAFKHKHLPSESL